MWVCSIFVAVHVCCCACVFLELFFVVFRDASFVYPLTCVMCKLLMLYDLTFTEKVCFATILVLDRWQPLEILC